MSVDFKTEKIYPINCEKIVYPTPHAKLHGQYLELAIKDDRISKAIQCSINSHRQQKRFTGEPYFHHPLQVAVDLYKFYKDIDLTIAGLLHDTVEDCDDISIEDIYKEFGSTVCFLVDAVNKKERNIFLYPNITFEDKIERLLWSGIQDIRVFLLKIADRDDNLKTLSFLKNHKQVRIGFETQAVFDPLKTILNSFDHTNPKISDLQNLFLDYLILNKCKTTKDLKTFLINRSFQNFDNKLFNFVYNNSGSVKWKIESYQLYKRICAQPDLSEKIHFLSVTHDEESFCAVFTFKKGLVFSPDIDTKFAISNYCGYL